MSFLRHAEIYRSDMVCKTFESWGRGTASRWSAPGPAKRRDGRTAPCSSSAMSFRAGYSLAGCSPAEPASASPTALSMRWGMSAGNYMSANGNLSLVSVSQHKGAVQLPISPFGIGIADPRLPSPPSHAHADVSVAPAVKQSPQDLLKPKRANARSFGLWA